MAKATIPGLKRSTGQQNYEPFPDGDYVLECQGVTVGPPKNLQPADVYTFKFKVLEGPPMPNGKPSKGRSYTEWVTVLQSAHPSYKDEWDDPASGEVQMATDQIRSMIDALGVVSKGDSVDLDACKGLSCQVHLGQKPDKNDPKKIRQVSRGWKALD